MCFVVILKSYSSLGVLFQGHGVADGISILFSLLSSAGFPQEAPTSPSPAVMRLLDGRGFEAGYSSQAGRVLHLFRGGRARHPTAILGRTSSRIATT
jgi:hypothetical protein